MEWKNARVHLSFCVFVGQARKPALRVYHLWTVSGPVLAELTEGFKFSRKLIGWGIRARLFLDRFLTTSDGRRTAHGTEKVQVSGLVSGFVGAHGQKWINGLGIARSSEKKPPNNVGTVQNFWRADCGGDCG